MLLLCGHCFFAQNSSFSNRPNDDQDKASLYGSRDSLISSSRVKDEVENNSKPTRTSSLTRTKSEDEEDKKTSWGSK